MMLLAISMLLAASPAKPPSPARVTADLAKACDKGKADACDELGNRYRLGVGTGFSDARAGDLFKKACAAKNQDGCADAAMLQALGLAGKEDPQAAIGELDKLCTGGLARACGNLGFLYHNGLGGKDDQTRGESLMADACKKGDLEACINVSGFAYQNGDLKRFEQYGRASCDNGWADGCATLGDLYLLANEQVHGAAALARACELGSVRGCTAQADLLLRLDADRVKAITLLDQSCAFGDTHACDLARAAKDKKKKK